MSKFFVFYLFFVASKMVVQDLSNPKFVTIFYIFSYWHSIQQQHKWMIFIKLKWSFRSSS